MPDLTFAHMPHWLAQADRLAAQDAFDLSGIGRIDSAGAAFLLELTRRAAQQGRTMSLDKVPDQVRSLLQFLQIDVALKLDS